MTSDLIKLKVKTESSKGNLADEIIQTFLKACLKLDASIFEPMIAEEQFFEEMDKYKFLASLKEQFTWAKNRGAAYISMKKGKCELCVLGHATYEFYGHKQNPEFAYIINTNGDEIKDIFLCNLSTGWNMNTKFPIVK